MVICRAPGFTHQYKCNSVLALLYEVDVLILTECSILPEVLLRTLNQPGTSEYYYAPGKLCRKVEVFTRFPGEFINPIHEERRLTIRHLKLPGATDILLAATHFPSKLHWTESSQASECIELASEIRGAEKDAGHSRTILVGDLKLPPTISQYFLGSIFRF